MGLNRYRIFLDWVDREHLTPNAFFQKHWQVICTSGIGQRRFHNIPLDVGYSWLAVGLCYEFGDADIQGIQPNPLTAIIAYAMIANALTKKNANSDPLTAWLEKMCSAGYQAMNGRLRRSTHLCQTAEIRPLEYECATVGDVARSFNNSEQCWLDCKDWDDFDY